MNHTLSHSTLSLLLPESRRMLVRSMVEAGNARSGTLNRVWHVVEEGTADITLRALPTEGGRLGNMLRAEVHGPAGELVFYPLHCPVQSTELFSMLNAASELLEVRPATHSAEQDDIAASARDLIEAWQRARNGGISRMMLRGPAGDLIHLDCDSDSWLMPAEAAGLDVERAARSLCLSRAHLHAQEHAPEGWTRRVSLKNLLWALACIASPKGLLPAAKAAPAFELRCWPYFIAKGPNAWGVMARALRAGPMTVADLASGSSATPDELAAFVNGCLLTGYLRAATRPRVQAPAEPRASAHPVARVGGLFRALASIRGALGLSTRPVGRA